MITPHQRRFLHEAANGDGEVSRWAAGRRTIDALALQKLIAPGQRITDKKERRNQEQRRDKHIAAARVQLEAGNWERAMQYLHVARDAQYALDATAWYITDAGRKAVG